jgi:hypothetical protein
MSSQTYTNAYLLTENKNTGSFTTTEQVQGSATINDPSGSTLEFGSPVIYSDSYNTLTLLFDGPVTENGVTVGFAAVDPASGAIYLFTDETIPANTDLVIDTGDPYTICFVGGTNIATPAGDRAIETLAIGDMVITLDGTAKPVKWIGRQAVNKAGAGATRATPIRIRAGALGNDLPAADLLVSPDHALLIDGVLVHASALVNGVSIVRETSMTESFTYYHIEMDEHALIMSEGVASETFVDNIQRRAFDNFAEYELLYPQGARVPELMLPRAKSQRQVPFATRTRLLQQAAVMYGEVAQAA